MINPFYQPSPFVIASNYNDYPSRNRIISDPPRLKESRFRAEVKMYENTWNFNEDNIKKQASIPRSHHYQISNVDFQTKIKQYSFHQKPPKNPYLKQPPLQNPFYRKNLLTDRSSAPIEHQYLSQPSGNYIRPNDSYLKNQTNNSFINAIIPKFIEQNSNKNYRKSFQYGDSGEQRRNSLFKDRSPQNLVVSHYFDQQIRQNERDRQKKNQDFCEYIAHEHLKDPQMVKSISRNSQKPKIIEPPKNLTQIVVNGETYYLTQVGKADP